MFPAGRPIQEYENRYKIYLITERDNVVITNAGAYAAALSPMQFSAQEKPVEVFLTQAGEILDS